MCITHENNISHEIHMKVFMCISLFLNVLAKNLHVCEFHLWHFACEGGDNLIELTIFDSQTTEGTGQQALSMIHVAQFSLSGREN